MAATGAQFMMFSTGRGAPQGFPTMPVLKVCGNPNTYERMSHDMDINAGRIITGEKSIEEVGEEAFSAILDLLSGKQTKNETLGYHSSIDIYTLGPVICSTTAQEISSYFSCSGITPESSGAAAK